MARANENLDFSTFLTGARIEDLEEPVLISLSADSEEPSDFLEFPYFLVSDRMRKALADCGVDNIQFFKAQLEVEASDKVIEGYWIGNIVGLVACVEPTKSQFKKLRGGKKGPLRQFQIDENAVRNQLLFRLAEDRTLVVIEDKVKEHLEAAGMNGIYYQATDQYDGEPASSFWE